MPKPINRQIVLVSRPRGLPDPSIFSMQEAPIPKPQENEVLVRCLYLTVDPYMRNQMNERPQYLEPFKLDEPPVGGVIAKVVESNCPGFKEGDIVFGTLGWADYSVAQPEGLYKLDPTVAPLTTSLGVLGVPGITAYFGLLEADPKEGDTVVVSGAAGAVGMLVGQIAKIRGCRVVGIAGSDEKVKYLINELNFDAAINYKSLDFVANLKTACPNGIDVYFDNVGGEVSDNCIKLINLHARIILCGQISVYNTDAVDLGPRLYMDLIFKGAVMKGFRVLDYIPRSGEAIKQMAQWMKEGKIKYRENIVQGLENTPRAFLGLFKGDNIGKQLVKVAE